MDMVLSSSWYEKVCVQIIRAYTMQNFRMNSLVSDAHAYMQIHSGQNA